MGSQGQGLAVFCAKFGIPKRFVDLLRAPLDVLSRGVLGVTGSAARLACGAGMGYPRIAPRGQHRAAPLQPHVLAGRHSLTPSSLSRISRPDAKVAVRAGGRDRPLSTTRSNSPSSKSRCSTSISSQVISGRGTPCRDLICSMTVREYYPCRHQLLRAEPGDEAHVDIDDVPPAGVVHLPDTISSQLTRHGLRVTSEPSPELPHPSIKILASFPTCAVSSSNIGRSWPGERNQSNDMPGASLRRIAQDCASAEVEERKLLCVPLLPDSRLSI